MPRSNTQTVVVPDRYDSKYPKQTRSTTSAGPPRSSTGSTRSATKPQRSATVQLPPKTKHHLPHNPFHHSHKAPPQTHQNATFTRPGGPPRQQTGNSVQTRYMSMLLDLDTIPRLHNIYASFFCWILLAGFIVFPATFTSLPEFPDNDDGNQQLNKFVTDVKSIKLLYVASFCSGIGALGMCSLWWRWRRNFVWLLNRIFLPGCLNSLAGLISTLVNVYAQQSGEWSVTAWVTAGVTAGACLICGVLFALYNFWILRRVKKMHRREMRAFGEEEGAEHECEGVLEKVSRTYHFR